MLLFFFIVISVIIFTNQSGIVMVGAFILAIIFPGIFIIWFSQIIISSILTLREEKRKLSED
ncbi:MAG: hypothetical protein ACFFAH_05330 [Promethearchaeota archaeon]